VHTDVWLCGPPFPLGLSLSLSLTHTHTHKYAHARTRTRVLVSDVMTRDPATCPLAASGQTQCPNLTVWMPVLLVVLAVSGLCLIALRRRGTPLEARAAAAAADMDVSS
jgi:hypothetical protein